MRRGDEAGLKALLGSYQGDWSPYWPYTQALLAFRDGGARNPKAARFARDARAQNAHVPGILAGSSPQVALDSDFITVGGADAGDFTESNTCGRRLKAGWDCTITVTFTPTATGARSATLSIQDAVGTQTVQLSGTGK